ALAKDLYGIGFYNTKAGNIQKLSAIIQEKYHGDIPKTREQLTSLPGVGRKTANCMLNYAFHQPAIAVDVHVHRISNRLGWVKSKTPEETEMALQAMVPKPLWIKVNMLLVGHGQTICFPRNPDCAHCPILKYCVYGRRQRIE
ncbi:endonuclease III, partial [Candidatus Woesearchaeota archaeon]|nr:endonuclease III [Candidatus Woesearchaeota archaeon]